MNIRAAFNRLSKVIRQLLWFWFWFWPVKVEPRQPLDPGNFLPKIRFFWTCWWFSGISAKSALIWSKMHLQYDSLPFLPLASRFTAFWLGRGQKSKFWTRECPRYLGFSIFEIVFSHFLFLLFFSCLHCLHS